MDRLDHTKSETVKSEPVAGAPSGAPARVPSTLAKNGPNGAASAPVEKKRGVRLFIGGLIVLAAGAVWWVYPPKPQAKVPLGKLSDGTPVAIERITFGREHRYGSKLLSKPVFRRVLDRLPRWLLPLIPFGHESANESLCVWIERPPSPNAPSGQPTFGGPWLNLEIADESGTRFWGDDWKFGRNLSSSKRLDGFGFDVFSRRSTNLSSP